MMNKQLLHTLEGLRDLHPADTGRKNLIEQNVMTIFRHYGYEQVQTPTFEYFDIYQFERGTKDGKNLFKFFNREGEILSLRPDVTPSVARYMATFYNHEITPKRFAYLGNVFYNNENYQGKLREYTQAGVECIGIGSEEADAESVAIAVNALLSTGLTEFQIDLGHAGFFKGIAEEAGLTKELQEEARKLIDEKNYIALEELLVDEKINDLNKQALLALPQLFGQKETLEKAKNLTKNANALEAIERLDAVYTILEEYELSNYISFDLGMVNKLQYYTGIIFKGFTYETGDSIVDGGRYDNLLDTFSYDAPAVGFAIKIDDVLKALERQGITIEIPTIDTLLTYDTTCRKTAIKLAETLRRQGMTVELGTSGMVEDSKLYGENKNIGGMMHLQDGDTVVLTNLATSETSTVSIRDIIAGGL